MRAGVRADERTWHHLEVGTIIIELVLRGFFYGGNVEDCLQQAFLDYSLWCKRHRLETTVDEWTRAKLKWPSGQDFPTAPGKAWDIKLGLLWANSAAQAYLRMWPEDQWAQLAATCTHHMATFVDTLQAGNMFLNQEEATRCAEV